jgi:hypothetical protein
VLSSVVGYKFTDGSGQRAVLLCSVEGKVFWDVKTCVVESYRRFGEIFCSIYIGVGSNTIPKNFVKFLTDCKRHVPEDGILHPDLQPNIFL